MRTSTDLLLALGLGLLTVPGLSTQVTAQDTAPVFGRTRILPTPAPVSPPTSQRVAIPLPRPRSTVPPPAPGRSARPAALDLTVKRVQAVPGQLAQPLGPEGAAPGLPEPGLPAPATAAGSAPSLSLQAALYGALTSNPDLVALRQGNVASAEAVEVARRFPTTLNPTLWVDYRPITLIPRDTFGSMSPAGGSAAKTAHQPFYHFGQNYFYISYRQPVELGHQTTHRYHMALAAYDQQQWTVLQAEMLALVQTYRFFQTAAYRREKLRVAVQLADFNEKLVKALRDRLEAGQGLAADLALAEVEDQATRQQVEAARQDYVTALTDLRNQLGQPETAGTAEPLGEFVLPPYIPGVQDQELVNLALQSRPEINVARAQVAGARAAVCLAKGDRIPSPIIGPEYQIDEAGVQYVGMIYVTTLPVLNGGKPLVRQREAELRRAAVTLQQIEQRTVAQVRAAVAKWNQANQLVARTSGLTDALKTQVSAVERLFEENQADVTKLFQARQRLIQLENAQLDAVWQATQAQSDLLLAIGAPALITSARDQAAEADRAPAPAPDADAAAPLPTPAAPPAATPPPFRPTVR